VVAGSASGDYDEYSRYAVFAPCTHGSCYPYAGYRLRGGLYNRQRDDRRRIRSLPGHRLSLHELNGLEAPSLEDLETLAADAYARLPPEFLAVTGNIIIRVTDFPTKEVLKSMEARDEFDLLGLFYGVGLAHREELSRTGALPNMIFLYRRPILDYWAGHKETLGDIVSHVLIHEIGHHFGLSDDDIDRLESEVP
jgi:predicted Zn-dependent protease with MMP-like domain